MSVTRRRLAASLLTTAALAVGTVAWAQGPASAADLPVIWEGSGHAQGFTYGTQGPVAGTTATASAMVVTPDGPAPAGGWPVIAYAHGTTGSTAQCGVTRGTAPGDRAQISHFVDRGYAVVAPDYLALGTSSVAVHPYLQSRTEAASVIDALHAAQAMRADLRPQWAVAGVSQGGHAALVTSHAAAGDPNFRGTLAIEPASGVQAIGAVMVPGIPNVPEARGITGFALAILAGLREARPDLVGDIDAHLSAAGHATMDRVASSCSGDWDRALEDVDLGTLFAAPVVTDAGLMAALDDYLGVPTGGYTRPILIAQGLTDTTVPYPLTAVLMAQLEAASQPVQLRTYPGNHGTTPGDAMGDMDLFLAGLPG